MSRSLAVVTGGASGLGKIIAWSLHRQGWHVAIADRDQDAGLALADELKVAAGRCTFIRVDISVENEVRRLFDQLATLGHLRVLVNNAGGWLPGPQFSDTDDWHRSLDLNLRMPMLATQLALPLMHDGGTVINISSSAGWDSAAYGSPEYAVAKAGLIRFTMAVADFADRFGVRVSCVVPHWIGLPRAVAEFGQMDAEARAQSGGLIDPQVVVDAVLELADDPNSAGRIVMVRAGRRPYPIDPAASDPLIDIDRRGRATESRSNEPSPYVFAISMSSGSDSAASRHRSSAFHV